MPDVAHDSIDVAACYSIDRYSSYKGMLMKKRVLFLSTANSVRSQMAEGLLRSIAGEKYEVFSAGTHPRDIHPLTLETMREVGIDISGQTSKNVSIFNGERFDDVITVCDRAKLNCPDFPGSAPVHWGFDDPAEASGSREEQLKKFEQVREEIMARLRLFVLADHH